VSGSFCGGTANVPMIMAWTRNGRISWDIDSYSSRSKSSQVAERLRMALPVTKE